MQKPISARTPNCDTGGTPYDSDSQGECPCWKFKNTYKTLNGCINGTQYPPEGGRPWKTWCENVMQTVDQ